MDNKKVLSKLVKIASNQQTILNKLAQEMDSSAADDALHNFIAYQLTSWGLPREIAAKEQHSADRVSGSKHYDVTVTLSLSDPSKKAVVEDPMKGFAAWLTQKFTTASKDKQEWKALEGYTASFKVTAN